MWRWLERLLTRFQGTQPADSVVAAASRVFPGEIVARVLLETQDVRMVVGALAKSHGRSERDVMERVAAELGLPFNHTVAPCDIAALPKGITCAHFRRAGALPVTEHGVIKGIVCVCPKLLKETIVGTEVLTISSAPWVDIARGLDESERAYETRREAEALRVRAEERSKALKSLTIIVKEVERFGSRECLVDLTGAGIRYRFTTNDGKQAFGEVSPTLRASLVALCETIGGGEIVEGLPFGFRVPKFTSENGGTIAWGPVVQVTERDQDTKLIGDSPSTGAVVQFPERSVKKVPTGGVGAGAQKGGRSRVLIVDDNVAFAQVLQRFLAKYDIVSTHAENGERGLELLKNGNVKPDLVVSDVHMPTMNGFEFLRRLREIREYTATPVVMLTSDDDVETELKLITDGADAFIPKNQDPRILCAHVTRLLARAQSQQVA